MEVGGREKEAGTGKNKHIIRVTGFPVQLEPSLVLQRLSCSSQPSGWVAAAVPQGSLPGTWHEARRR